MSDFNISKFKDKFIKDSENLLNELENDLIKLEANPKELELIESIFRVMHTLKGVGSMFGFDNISNYTHRLESVYDAIREDTLQLSPEIFQITFNSLDHLRNLLFENDHTKAQNIQTQKEHIQKIDKILSESGQEIADIVAVDESSNTKKQNTGIKTWYILMKSCDDFINRGIKILYLFKDISKLGRFEIVKKTQGENENEEYWSIFLSTSAGLEDIEDILLFILDECKITKIADHDILSNSPDLLDVATLMDNNSATRPAPENNISILDAITNLYEETEEGIQTKPEQKAKKKEKKQIELAKKSYISVDTEKLDRLMQLVSEMVTTNSALSLAAQTGNIVAVEQISTVFGELSRYFRDNVLDIRLVPVNNMLLQFRRLIRDLSISLSKKIQFISYGDDTELDKNIIDTIAEPIMHIIRNCIDHGVESPEKREKQGKSRTGKIIFNARQSGNYIFIEISDDGAGIDLNKMHKKAVEKGLMKPKEKMTKKKMNELVFMPGFSTAKSLSQVSGRGVGMDVVFRKIKDIRGEIDIDTKKGVGTKFTIRLQQSISIIDTLLLQVGNAFYTLALDEIEICSMVNHSELSDREDNRIKHNNKLIPYINLRDEFNIDGNPPDKERIIIIKKQKKRYAFIADKIIGEHQAVVKPLGKMLSNVDSLTGAGQLGDGTLAFMLNTENLIQKHANKSKAHERK